SAIMDQYDPEKKVGLSVDEWGNWFTVEPGTNPGFLYQQNTVRDALVAGITLDIFNKHSDRVKMACLAQMVNVLQSVILTEGEKMLRTPTYHVFHMYRYHQGAELLESYISGAEETGSDEWKIPALHESVSVKDGVITATINNLSCDKEEELEVDIAGADKYDIIEARILTDEMHAYNTFENPDKVIEKEYSDYSVDGNLVKLVLPPASVVELRFDIRK
ncbi:MAG: alpha-N-arabinofuranosidase, partial [Eubacterium sp.]|nr:alpha-N-arabinofuranosidase [Eubacterium sp.]